ncbi:MAG: hypothetical protein R8K49_06245 [Mariprofundaceae bacterium]
MSLQNFHLKRRGFDLGQVQIQNATQPTRDTIITAWKQDKSIVLPALLNDAIKTHHEHIQAAFLLMQDTLKGDQELIDLLDTETLTARLQPEFSLLASSPEDHDEQGIEKIYFDKLQDDEIMAEDLWCKASWLSFHDEDASLRFRFSFGMEGYEDVAADPMRQAWAGELCERIFPESEAITQNPDILSILEDILGHQSCFVERIVYFNAPNGGAQFHHDVERGHAGVIFAQITGSTFWLALDKPRLIDAIIDFSAQHSVNKELQELVQNRQALADGMDESDHQAVETLIDQDPAFIAYMVEQGHCHILNPGDVLFLPQRDLEHCVWHSVFTLGDSPGEALSFAVR